MKKTKLIKLTPRLSAELFPSKIRYFSLSWLLYTVILILSGYIGWISYLTFTEAAPKLTTEKISIDESYIQKLNTLEDFTVPVDSPSSDFGRDNPFGDI
jgi:cytoskeletal protein RodZ